MDWVITLAALGFAVAAMQAVPQVKSNVHHAKPVTHQVSPARSTAKGGKSQHVLASNKTPGSRSSHRGRSTKGRAARHSSGPSYQTHPDSDRYQEIQKALADKGYFKGDPNGQWDSDSVDALKRFQADQRLDPDGKINARTLFGLGLGPKRDGSAVASATTPAPGTAAAAPQ